MLCFGWSSQVIPIPRDCRSPQVHCLAATFPRASSQWGHCFCGLELRRAPKGAESDHTAVLTARLLFVNAPAQSLRILAVRRVSEVSKWGISTLKFEVWILWRSVDVFWTSDWAWRECLGLQTTIKMYQDVAKWTDGNHLMNSLEPRQPNRSQGSGRASWHK